MVCLLGGGWFVRIDYSVLFGKGGAVTLHATLGDRRTVEEPLEYKRRVAEVIDYNRALAASAKDAGSRTGYLCAFDGEPAVITADYSSGGCFLGDRVLTLGFCSRHADQARAGRLASIPCSDIDRKFLYLQLPAEPTGTHHENPGVIARFIVRVFAGLSFFLCLAIIALGIYPCLSTSESKIEETGAGPWLALWLASMVFTNLFAFAVAAGFRWLVS